MRVADRQSVNEPLFRQYKNRFRIALTERASLLQPSKQIEGDPASRHGAVDHQRIPGARSLDILDQRRVEMSAKIVKLGAAERDARRHCVTAALLDKAKLDTSPNREPQIDAT